MDIQIRRANSKDIKQIDNIESSLEHRILSYDTLSSTLDNKSYIYMVASVNNIIVGYIVAELLVDHLDLLAIAINKDYRRKNIASTLILELFKTCKSLNVDDIFLEVRCNNMNAIKLYEKVGFEKISSRKNYYKDTGEDAFIYKKTV